MMAQRKIDDIDKTILDNFYKLVHEQPSLRLRAAASTFKILQAFQKHNDPRFNINLNYCIERLVLGLSSSRAQARRGYAVLLLELLKHHQITTERLLSIANSKFGPIHKDTSKDELLGHFLLNTLIITSGNLSKSKANSNLTEKVYRSLVNLHKVKSYFDFPVCDTLKTNLELFYQFMLIDIPKGAFELEQKTSQLQLMIISLCNSKRTIKEYLALDTPKIKQIITTLKESNLKRLPLHPLLIAMSEDFIKYFTNHFELLYKDVIDCQVDIMKELMNVANIKTLLSYVNQFIDLFVKKNSDRDRASISQLLVYAIRRPQMIDEKSTILKVVKICMVNSMFKSKPTDDRRFNPVVQSYHSALDCLISVCNSAQRVELLNELLETVKLDYIKDKTQLELWRKFYSSWEAEKSSLMSDKTHKHLSCIASLYLLYGLQIIEHGLDCKKQLEELVQSKTEVITGDPTDGSWADILTDQIIAILSATECDPWIRNLCDKVFGSLLPHISQTSIDLLCDALAPHPEDISDEEGEDDSHDEDSYESDSDGEDAKSIGSEADKLDSDQSAESGNEGEHGNTEDADVKMNVDEEEDDDEEYMDDEQMMKYDKVLAAMFKLKRLDKKKDSDQIGFKLRLLDLVKRILKKRNKDQETITLLLNSIIPLAKSCKSSKESLPIYTKVKGIVSKMPAKGKYPEVVKFLKK